jgi:superfamily I DNA/RNA helicase
MLGRLAAHVFCVNPLILKALRATYAYLFLDEFQDTTDIQYDLTRAAFLGSNTVITSVGDPKQRIMRWAGAMEGVFENFRVEFGAKVYQLLLNHRSAPELVRIQMYLAQSIEQKTAPMQAVDDGSTGAGECRILEFDDIFDEASVLAELIESWINSEHLLPRDICVLTRIQPSNYTPTLTSNLLKLGIASRVESELQDLLAEPITTIVISFLRLGSGKRHPEAWMSAIDVLKSVRGDDEETSEREIEKTLTNFVRRLRKTMNTTGTSEAETRNLVLHRCA